MHNIQLEQKIKDCRNCKNGKYNDYHNVCFCYALDNCTDWNLWEPQEPPSVQPEQNENMVSIKKLIETIKYYSQYPDGISRLLKVYEET